MKRVILHIGRQKTGTTAIQQFLYANRSLLKSHDIHYPQFGIRGFGHHEIGGPLSRIHSPKYRRSHSDVVATLRCGLLEEIQDNGSLIVMSSESFQNCDPGLVRQLLTGYEVEVVVYLREQVGFLASAYAQKVQASDYSGSLEEFCQANMFPDYQRFIEPWNNEFSSRVSVKIYDRNELVKGDVVADFCESFLRIPSEVVNELRTKNDPNPTLTQDLLEFKLRVNQQCSLSPENAELLFKGLAELSITDTSGKISVPAGLIDGIARHYDKSNRRVARKYFNREHLFAHFSQPADRASTEKPESRLTHIRDKLATLHPTLTVSLSHLQF
jgi:hypothetical protein